MGVWPQMHSRVARSSHTHLYVNPTSLTGVGRDDRTSSADYALDIINSQSFLDQPGIYSKCHENVLASMRQRVPDGLTPVSDLRLRPNSKERFLALTARSRMYFARNIGNAIARIGTNAFLGILLGLVYYQTPKDRIDSRLQMLFFAGMMTNLLPFQSISLFLDTRQYYIRERVNELYKPWEFFFANLVWEIIVIIVSASSFAIIGFWMADIPGDGGNFMFLLLTFNLMYFTSSALMTAIANFMPNMDLTFVLGAALVSIFMLFAGLFIRLGSLSRGLRWIPYLT
jgi:hypothetical protein